MKCFVEKHVDTLQKLWKGSKTGKQSSRLARNPNYRNKKGEPKIVWRHRVQVGKTDTLNVLSERAEKKTSVTGALLLWKILNNLSLW